MRVYAGLNDAYAFFNRELFGDQLPPCLITLQRHRRAYGYFSRRRFARVGADEDVTDEIALNPAHFRAGAEGDALSTLVHEMAHLWQYHFGKPGRGNYHNQEWAEKMQGLGLIPSQTGKPGGKMTGQPMTHYIAPDGLFARVCAAYLAQGRAVFYRDIVVPQTGGAEKDRSKTKYTCPGCGLNAWAKPEVTLFCGACNLVLYAEE